MIKAEKNNRGLTLNDYKVKLLPVIALSNTITDYQINQKVTP
jgi:hypothetical protein